MCLPWVEEEELAASAAKRCDGRVEEVRWERGRSAMGERRPAPQTVRREQVEKDVRPDNATVALGHEGGAFYGSGRHGPAAVESLLDSETTAASVAV